jgi:N-acetylmuramoyl-L-alanine amidase
MTWKCEPLRDISPPSMARALLSFIAVFMLVAVSRASDWVLYSVGGRDYVSMKNVAEFYSLDKVQRDGNEVVLMSKTRSLRAYAGSSELFINNLKFILSYPAVEHSGQICISRMDLVKLVEPVMRPSRIKNNVPIDTVVLDAGHGGHDAGARSQFGHEKEYTLDTVFRAKELLQQAGYKVVLTRTGDYFVPLDDRAQIANRYQSAIFISIHFNHGGMGTGVEAFTLAPRGVPSMMADGPAVSDFNDCPGNARDQENMALATASHAALVMKTRMTDRGLKRARFVVIRNITIPGVLIEGGFMSNPYDSKMIATPLYRQTLASAVLQAVENYRKAVGPKSAPVPEKKPPAKKAPAKSTGSKPAPIDPPKTEAN